MAAWKPRKIVSPSVAAYRIGWLRVKLVGGWYVHQIIDAAQMEPVFRVRPLARNPRDRLKVLSRGLIHKLIDEARKQIHSERHDDPGVESSLAYERMMAAYQMAERQSNPLGMVAAQKVINRMMGVNRDKVEVGFDVATLRQQLLEMDKATHG